MSNVSSAPSAAAPKAVWTTFEHDKQVWNVKDGQVQKGWLRGRDESTLKSVQDAYKNKNKNNATESIPLYKLPYVLVKTIVSTVWNALLNVLTWCFPKGESVEGDKGGKKTATTTKT